MQRRPTPFTARALYRERAFLRVGCLSATCSHQTHMGPLELIQLGHGDTSLWAVAKKMKCTRCGAIGAQIDADWR